MDNIDKKILMIYDQLYIGGIETLIIRTSKWLLDNGYEVKLILRDKGTLFESLDKRVQVKVYQNFFELLFTPFFANAIFNGSFYDDIKLVYTFRPEGLWIASVLAKVKRAKIKVFNCVYHPYEFFIKGRDHYQTKFYSKLLLSDFPTQNLAFMNIPCKVSHELFFRKTFDNAFIFPLPVGNGSVQDTRRIPIKYKIVSIGNFKSFKTYNLYMIDIIGQLIREGYPVQYEIYGDGEMKSEIVERINKKRLNQYIQLKGQVPYENFKDVLTNAFLFIGMGTAAVEAALSKVPTIVATCDSSKTYGYMYNMPGFAVGEQIEGLKEYSVKDLIIRSFSQTSHEYEEECLKNYQHALRYDMNILMNSLVEKFEAENKIEYYSFQDLPLRLYRNYYLSRILYKLSYITSKIANKLSLSSFSQRVKPQLPGENER